MAHPRYWRAGNWDLGPKQYVGPACYPVWETETPGVLWAWQGASHPDESTWCHDVEKDQLEKALKIARKRIKELEAKLRRTVEQLNDSQMAMSLENQEEDLQAAIEILQKESDGLLRVSAVAHAESQTDAACEPSEPENLDSQDAEEDPVQPKQSHQLQRHLEAAEARSMDDLEQISKLQAQLSEHQACPEAAAAAAADPVRPRLLLPRRRIQRQRPAAEFQVELTTRGRTKKSRRAPVPV
ncbi:unnamed protein product [Symbiodinium natans]|uniref:Uncharacterized protein n=1 Tax=Symbiodinium natans TaxID=878477 RepID=A0A812QW26_9DINO|nr:unnamed protein product [Symbiodinium natans]